MHPVFQSVRSGDLDKALALSEAAVRESPSCPQTREMLADVLMVRGEYERAETHLNAVLRFDPSRQREVDSLLQLLRAECDRQQVFHDGRSPQFLVPPDEPTRMRLGALAHHRAGNASECNRMLAEAAALDPVRLASIDGAPEAALLDWDSRFGANIEALTATGRYYWIPLALVQSIEFAPVRSLRDLAWRSAVVMLGAPAGPAAESNAIFIFMPTRYPGSESSTDGLLRAGCATEWTEPCDGVGIGLGQRMFVCGESTHSAVSVGHVRLAGEGAASG